ncbi:phage major capsid protein [Pseudoalteromonas piratica]|uniref:Capsid protein n=1 Tax=Pseudoalteromonas piratica TaxID=1348114 RepID=A0A0A7EGU9_9GAMM|nr:phage major capsid protein [Pseudoalteromonas piratica]AIY65192.1 capsid protein [Pseudoalteromonas piratica]
MGITQMRREQAAIADQVKALADKEQKGEQLSAEDQAKFTELSTQFDELTAKISRAEQAEKMAAATAEPVKSAITADVAIQSKKAPAVYPGAKAARFAMSVAAAENNPVDAAKFAESELGDKEVAMALSTASNSGGVLVPENIASEVIELLRPKAVVRSLGARVMPLVSGNLSIPRLIGGATSSYKGENDAQNAESGQLDDVKLSSKTQMTIVPMSNELIGKSGFAVEQIFLSDMIAAIATRQDKAFLRDDGTNNTPTGFKAVATTAGQTVAWSGSKTVAEIDAYLNSLILKVMESDSLLVSPGWGLSPRTFMTLKGLRDGKGNLVYPELAQMQLKGYPVQHTSTIPANLGAGTNESEIYFADWNDVIIGESDQLTIDFSREATYNDNAGNLVSAYSRNQSVLRVVTGNDVGFRHNEGLALGTGVTW